MDAPVLPFMKTMHFSLVIGWTLVMAWVFVATLKWVSPVPLTRPRRVWAAWLAVIAGLVCILPGEWSPTYYLGLAFQTPSLMSMVLCAVALWHWLGAMPALQTHAADPTAQARETMAILCAALAGVALGWCLLLDTLALVRGSVYAWGYGRYALWGVLAVVFVWMLALRFVIQASVQRFAMPVLLVLVVFASTHVATGNVWDALLDPWLWIVSHCVLAQKVKLRFKRSSLQTLH
jgi:divalent metal cation (Fe/Co/Zn/Cd) transporter